MAKSDPNTLAGTVHAQQDAIESRIDASLQSLDQATLDIWNELMKIVRQVSPGDTQAAYFRALAAARELLPSLYNAMGNSLLDIARFTHEANLNAVLTRLPPAYLQALRDRARVVADQSAALPTNLVRFQPTFIDPTDGKEKRNEFTKYLFRAPDAERVGEILKRGNWQARFEQMSRVGNPDQVASIVAQGFSQGKTPAEIARDIKPAVEGLATSAKLRARTLGQQVAHTIRMDAYESMGDLIEAYQIHATKDNRVRPEHQERDGRIYWKDPDRGPYNTSKMPQPPLEDDGKLAWNCRCYLTPRLRPVSKLKKAA